MIIRDNYENKFIRRLKQVSDLLFWHNSDALKTFASGLITTSKVFCTNLDHLFLSINIKKSRFCLVIPTSVVKWLLASYTLIFVKNYQPDQNMLQKTVWKSSVENWHSWVWVKNGLIIPDTGKPFMPINNMAQSEPSWLEHRKATVTH